MLVMMLMLADCAWCMSISFRVWPFVLLNDYHHHLVLVHHCDYQQEEYHHAFLLVVHFHSHACASSKVI